MKSGQQLSAAGRETFIIFHCPLDGVRFNFRAGFSYRVCALCELCDSPFLLRFFRRGKKLKFLLGEDKSFSMRLGMEAD